MLYYKFNLFSFKKKSKNKFKNKELISSGFLLNKPNLKLHQIPPLPYSFAFSLKVFSKKVQHILPINI